MGERTSAAADACVISGRIGLHIAIIRAHASRSSEPRHRDASDKRDDHNPQMGRAIRAVDRVVQGSLLKPSALSHRDGMARKKTPAKMPGSCYAELTDFYVMKISASVRNLDRSMELILGHPRPGHNHIDQRSAIVRTQE
jgi:hypothetical protein